MTTARWHQVCDVSRVAFDRGVAALVDGPDGNPHMVALFRLSPVGAEHPEEWLAVDHFDPVAQAPVMARGLVGSVGCMPTIASPITKQRYDLRTGDAVGGDSPSLRSWRVRVTDGQVEIQGPVNALEDNVMV